MGPLLIPIVAALAGLPGAFLPSRLPAPRPEPERLFCQTDLPPYGVRRVAWFNLVVDKEYKRHSASLYLKTDNFEAQWAYDQGLDGPSAMEAFDYQLDLPPGAQMPVMVNILFDDRLASQRIYTNSLQNALVYRDGHIDYYQTLKLSEFRVPNVFGHHSMVAQVRGADGKLLTESRIPLPDWTWVERETRQAERDAEVLRRKRRCIPDT